MVTNHVTGEHNAALGEQWNHICNSRLQLSWNGTGRLATLKKHPFLPFKTAPFEVVVSIEISIFFQFFKTAYGLILFFFFIFF